jgi:hypothetical protein
MKTKIKIEIYVNLEMKKWNLSESWNRNDDNNEND